MKALQRFKAKLRGKPDRNARIEPSVSLDDTLPESSSQPPSIVNTEPEPEIRTNGSKLCDTCTKLLRLVCRDPDEEHPFPPNVAELEELPPVDCPFCYLRWRMMPPTEREKLRGCRSIDVEFQSNSNGLGGIIRIIYSYPVQSPKSGSYFANIICQACTICSIDQSGSSFTG